MTGSLIAVLAVVFAALLMLALLVVGSMGGDNRGRDVADRIERYGPRHASAPAGGEGDPARSTVGWVTRLLRSTNSERGLAERLDLAGSERKPAEWVLLGIGGCALLAAALTFATGNLLIGVLGGSLLGWLGMRAALSIRIGRRRAAFSEQLPDVLQLIAGSLQSGFSLPQAVDAVVREGSQPAAGELSRALAEARIGAELEDALNRVADRMDSTDLRWAVMAIRIQREVGGNLAEVLRTTVGTMRERAFLRRQVRALSAEGRLSAYILVALPVVIGGWFFYSDPGYMRPLYTTLAGLVMLVGSVVLVGVGALWMRKLIKIEV
jgi:Flp pilus assembly protein TadB